LPISPSFSPDTGQVVSWSGLDGVEAAEFVSPARPASGKARNEPVNARIPSIFNVFIIISIITTPIIHQSSKKPSKKFIAGFPARRGNANTTFRRRNEAPPKIEKNMKTRILLVTIGAAALAAITLNVNASDVLLSPRAAGNQIKTAPDVTAAQPAFTTQAVSPRALGNQAKTVASLANDVNPVMECHKMIASPKAIQACAANPTGMSGCCKAAMADNTAR
jgi:hypothetical protein